MVQKTTEYHTTDRGTEIASDLLEQLGLDEEGQARPIGPYLRLEHPCKILPPLGQRADEHQGPITPWLPSI